MRRWARPAAALLLALTSPVVTTARPAHAAPVEAALGAPIAPFATCPNYGYMVTLPMGSGRSTFNRYDIGTATLQPIKQFGFVVNAIGLSRTQLVFWGLHSVDNAPDALVRFDSAGNLDEVGVPTDAGGMPLPTFEALAGTVDGDVLIVHTREPANHLMRIDVNPASPTFTQVLSDVTLSRTTPGVAYLNIGDWDVFDQDGLLYAIELSSAFRKVVKIDPATGVVTDVADLSADLPESDNYGAAFMEDGSGNLYVSANNIISGGAKTDQSQTFMIRTTHDPVIVTAYAKGTGLRVNDGGDCLVATDFGDAPDSYGTLDASGGPAHILTSYLHHGMKLRLGTKIDADLDGFDNAAGTTDDDNIPGDNDEDGLPAGTKISAGHPSVTIPVTNTTGLAAVVAGWLDANRNGKFDANERATRDLAASATSATLTWPAFTLATSAKTFLRLRIYQGGATEAAAGPQPGGWVNGGEVEDHQVTLTPAVTAVRQNAPAAAPPAAATGDVPPATKDWDDDGDIDYNDALLAQTGFVLRPYLMLGIGLVLVGLALLTGALIFGPRKMRRSRQSPESGRVR
ncbi:GEVED domain-containing protein [Hamadaea tsunoensis]|uniref:GEVED domain-containing protein n=1 Tax=Hamadaea tsunoensis TaxID=53368 RepID=UPI0012F8DF21|nr:GEVED domain-containing protein [Hamadaea tsunoensis]